MPSRDDDANIGVMTPGGHKTLPYDKSAKYWAFRTLSRVPSGRLGEGGASAPGEGYPSSGERTISSEPENLVSARAPTLPLSMPLNGERGWVTMASSWAPERSAS